MGTRLFSVSITEAKTTASRTIVSSRKQNVYIIWINLATIDQDKGILNCL